MKRTGRRGKGWINMNTNYNSVRKAEIKLKMSEFEFPPMQDVVLVGKRAPIGPEAAKRMVDALSPEQYRIVSVQHAIFEAVVIRNSLLQLLPMEKLLQIVLDEGSHVATEDSIIKTQVNIHVEISRVIDL